MNDAVRNVMRHAGIALRDAVAMATINPARVCGVPGRSGGLSAGERADIIAFRCDPGSGVIQVEATYVSGQRVWSREGAL
jgi:N-acetylglucosamine-6-phosphate deacetylase